MHLAIIKIIKGEMCDCFLSGGAKFCVAKLCCKNKVVDLLMHAHLTVYKRQLLEEEQCSAGLDLYVTCSALWIHSCEPGPDSLGRLLHFPH